MKNVPGKTDQEGIIAWFAANHVAANLLMLFIIVAGLVSVSSIRKEMQPKFQIDWVRVTVPYLGAAPQEVEEGVVIKVEEAIQDVPGIKRIIGEAFEGSGRVTAEVEVIPQGTVHFCSVSRRLSSERHEPMICRNVGPV